MIFLTKNHPVPLDKPTFGEYNVCKQVSEHAYLRTIHRKLNVWSPCILKFIGLLIFHRLFKVLGYFERKGEQL